jgi:D-aminoacyl-tRNA deacylase
MKVVLQRVKEARVEVSGEVSGRIERGLLLLLGVARGDTEKDADYLAAKTLGLRVFPDENGKMNRSVVDVKGGILVVSQFTLLGDCSKGRRPSFDRAAPPEEARRLYDYFVDRLKESGLKVGTGVFQAMMDVHLLNDGPVTLLYESERML